MKNSLLYRVVLLVLLSSLSLFALTVTTEKLSYKKAETVKVTLKGMFGDVQDWIAIYPVNVSNDWNNVVSWTYTNGIKDGVINLKADAPVGDYEIRAFYKNSFTVEARALFKIANLQPINTSATLDKLEYKKAETVKVTIKGMLGNAQDWVAIYPIDATNDWENVVSWSYTNGVKGGVINLKADAHEGNYEVRVFFKNSYKVEAKAPFSIKIQQANATIKTSKPQYDVGEVIKTTVTGMLGDKEDWIAVFAKNAPNKWGNVKSWTWTNGIKNGTLNLDAVPAGEYEVRAFFANTYIVKAKASFSVKAVVIATTVKTSKNKYQVGEKIKVTLKGMLGNSEDWVGIYPQGSTNDWDNIVSWSWTNGIKNGTVTLDNVPAGFYDVRVFFANSFDIKAKQLFSVVGNQGPKLLENAEHGLSAKWKKVLGIYQPKLQNGGFQSAHCVKLTPQWKHIQGNDWENSSEFRLDLDHRSTHKVMEMDLGGVGVKMPHYFIGAQVITTKGERSMIWDSYFKHQNLEPFRTDYGNGNIELAYPSPVEQVRGWGFASVNLWNHFKVNLEKSLQILEPENHILYIQNLKFSGGFLDNITLSK